MQLYPFFADENPQSGLSEVHTSLLRGDRQTGVICYITYWLASWDFPRCIASVHGHWLEFYCAFYEGTIHARLDTAKCCSQHINWNELVWTDQGCSGAGTRGNGVPHFFRQGGRVPHSPTFLDWNSCKRVHCGNWLLTETQCWIISVQQKIIFV